MAPAEVEPLAGAVKPEAPLTYVVKKGDTLWDIANHFLSQPWQWPEIWVANTQVKNPHLIYPGQVLTLTWVNGRPQIGLNGDKLEPRIRESSMEEAIPTIPYSVIRDFLSYTRLLTPEQIKASPYVVDFQDPHIVGGPNMGIYVTHADHSRLGLYDVVRIGERYVDPDTGKELGIEGIPVGGAELVDTGSKKVAGTAEMGMSEREVRKGDILLPARTPDSFNANFYPHAPKNAIRGRIIAARDALAIPQYGIVTINKGATDGVEVGHVLSILQAGRESRDPYDGHLVALPETYAGLAMVFEVNTHVSYALVMKEVAEVHLLDVVVRPTGDQR